MPQTILVKPEPDFWARMCKTGPQRALSELIWNSMDADADEIIVQIHVNAIDGIEKVTIDDNGTGILLKGNEHDFSHLGGSWKSKSHKTRRQGRILHGKNGQGRFRAFSLGAHVVWDTTFDLNGTFWKYSISGRTDAPGCFIVSDPESFETSSTGTSVTIFSVDESAHHLRSDSAHHDISRVFAPYLNQYRSIKLSLNGKAIDSSDLVAHSAKFHVGPIKLSDGNEISGDLEIIEWKFIKGRALYLCDKDGFALAERAPDIRAPGFDFGAYLKSSLFRELDDSQLLDFELTESVTVLVAAARLKMLEYFRKREEEKTASLIERWKKESVYPYKETPTTEVGRKAQRVFNMCAVTIHEHVATFEDQDTTMKALSFRLLREAVEVSPGAVARIMSEFINLPKKKQELFSELLEKTTLSSILDAVHDIELRISIATGLRALVCDHDTRNSVKERQHIHKIVEANPWIFGEEFALGVSESSLTNALRWHLKELKRDVKALEPVLKASGQAGRIDLLLAKRVKRSGRNDDDHLIIELKRANKILGLKELNQIEEYANAMMRDARFDRTDVRWHFWLVGVELNADLEERSNSGDREPGCAHVFKDGRSKIWVKTWSQVLHDCLSRLEFVREKLNLAITEEEAIKVLDRIYPQFVPNAAERDASKDDKARRSWSTLTPENRLTRETVLTSKSNTDVREPRGKD